jgi:hypothetical protein
MSGSSRGHKISTREGSVIDFDLTYKFLEYGSHSVLCVRFEKPNQSDLPPLQPSAREPVLPPLYFRFPSELPTPQDCQPHHLHIRRALVAVPGIKI